MQKKIASALAVLFIAGCSTYADQKIADTKAAGSVLDRGTAYFCQDASYATREGVYRAGEVLSHLLGFWTARGVVLVRFKSSSNDEFSSEYLDKDLNVSGARHYVKGTDYQVGDDGTIEIKTSSRCEGGGGPGLGCESREIRLFTDRAGNLAVIQATAGVGIVGIVPVAGHSKYLSLFPSVDPARQTLQTALAQCPESMASKRQAEFEKHRVLPTFAVGDVIVPYRHYDHRKKEFLPAPAPGLEDTKWLVQDINDKSVRVELIEGEYKPTFYEGKKSRTKGFVTDFFSSEGYKSANPYGGNHGQTFQEFRKDH